MMIKIVGVKNSFNRLMKGINIAIRKKLYVEINTIATPEKIKSGELLRVINIAKEIGVNISLNIPNPLGRWKNNSNIVLSNKEWNQLIKFTKFSWVRWEGNFNYITEGCPAATEKIHLTPYGDIMPCSFIHIKFGNIRQQQLKEIWKYMLSFNCLNYHFRRCPSNINLKSLNDLMKYNETIH